MDTTTVDGADRSDARVLVTGASGVVGEPTDDYRALTGETPTSVRAFADDYREVWA
jgi:hypothetical protein